ncbi:MAG: acyl carrier protein [Bacteroidales bacterium]
MKNLEKYKKIFTDVFSVEESKLNEQFTRDIVSNWDSIHQLNLIVSIEDNFDVMFDTDDSLSLTSYFTGIQLLSKKYDIEF